MPDAPGHVLYVWFDALTNYLTGAGYGCHSRVSLDWLHALGLCTLNQVDPQPITYNLSNP